MPTDDLKYWWSDDEEIIRSDAFDTREQAYSDAYCSRAQCFDVPGEHESFYLHHGRMVDNPDFDEDAHKHYGFDESNFPQLFDGKTEKIDALTVTDFFHDQWIKLSDKKHDPALPLGLTATQMGDGTVCRAGWALLRLFKPAQERFGEEATRTDYNMVDDALTYAFKLVQTTSPQNKAWLLFDASNKAQEGMDVTDATHIMAPPNMAIARPVKRMGTRIARSCGCRLMDEQKYPHLTPEDMRTIKEILAVAAVVIVVILIFEWR